MDQKGWKWALTKDCLGSSVPGPHPTPLPIVKPLHPPHLPHACEQGLLSWPLKVVFPDFGMPCFPPWSHFFHRDIFWCQEIDSFTLPGGEVEWGWPLQRLTGKKAGCGSVRTGRTRGMWEQGVSAVCPGPPVSSIPESPCHPPPWAASKFSSLLCPVSAPASSSALLARMLSGVKW